jgi:hypothetical protein
MSEHACAIAGVVSGSLPGLRSGARGLNFRFGEPVPAGGAAGAMVTVRTANLVDMRLILIILIYGQSDLIFFNWKTVSYQE